MIELLAVQLRQNRKIRGLKVKGEELLLVQFTDDLGLVLEFNQRIWEEVKNTFDQFQAMSGMLINYEKSVVYRIGSMRQSNAKFYSNKKLHWTDKPFKVLGIYLSANKKEIYEANIPPLIKRAQAVLEVWKHRSLSLYGKILTINALVASLFVYQMSVLEMFPGEIHTEVKKLFTNYIWGGKVKLSHKILEGLKTDGGGGLANLLAREQALKITWVYKLQDSSVLRALSDTLLNNPLGELLWKSQLSQKHIKILFPMQNFWVDVLKCWAKFSNVMPIEKTAVLQQQLWYNSSICVNELPVFYEKWSAQGVNKISDLLNEKFEWKTFNEMKETIPGMYITDYYGILDAIPTAWKELLKQDSQEASNDEQMTVLENVANYSNKVQVIYRMLNHNPMLLADKALKLSRTIGIEIETEDLVRLVSHINKISICSKLRSFQYRLLMSSIITKVHLMRYGITDNDRCSFCNSEVEYIKHLLVECEKVKDIWRSIECNYDVGKLDKQAIITNVVNTNPKNATNCIVLVTKYYIYSSKCQEHHLSVENCKQYIERYVAIEEEIARSKNKLTAHQIKWSI